jgi:hypothetical protein
MFWCFFYCFWRIFYSYSNQTAASPNYLEKYMIYFLSWGVIMLLPTILDGWNLYLINGNYINQNTLKFYYVGTLVRTLLE